MRVRSFELRLIGLVLVGLWLAAASAILLAYRPGGPIDMAVGVAAIGPALIALAGLAWPPVVRGARAFQGILALGVLTTLVLVPSIGDIVGQLLARGPQTLLPSLEAAYPWLVALFATSLFAGLGLARHQLGGLAPRRHRLRRAVLLAAVLTAAAGGLFGGLAAANDVALRGRPAPASRFGPTDPARMPPPCGGAVTAGTTAALLLNLDADVGGHPIGTVSASGFRDGRDVRWTADVASESALGQYALARVGDRGWTRAPRGAWVAVDPGTLDSETVDLRVLQTALLSGARVASEDRGLEFIEGARTRHCRVAVDGPTFVAAFPQVRWLVGDDTLAHWRGQLDFWVFSDGEVGQIAGDVNGLALNLPETGIQGTIRVRLQATDRDHFRQIAPPG
jgi:hypothetical protein